VTWAEAEIRADLLWPDVVSVWRTAREGGPLIWIVNTAEGIRRAVVHTMDETGRPTCHPECLARGAEIPQGGRSDPPVIQTAIGADQGKTGRSRKSQVNK
jgi:hypothetical protein